MSGSKRFNQIAARVRVIEAKVDALACWPSGSTFGSQCEYEYARAQLLSHAIHCDHGSLLGYMPHYPSSAAFAARHLIGKPAYQRARRVHRRAAALRHPSPPPAPRPRWRPVTPKRKAHFGDVHTFFFDPDADVFVPASREDVSDPCSTVLHDVPPDPLPFVRASEYAMSDVIQPIVALVPPPRSVWAPVQPLMICDLPVPLDDHEADQHCDPHVPSDCSGDDSESLDGHGCHGFDSYSAYVDACEARNCADVDASPLPPEADMIVDKFFQSYLPQLEKLRKLQNAMVSMDPAHPQAQEAHEVTASMLKDIRVAIGGSVRDICEAVGVDVGLASTIYALISSRINEFIDPG
mmetsp:Transcript_43357/g.87398  ORF Transcript_43357/g.87398 Transcript_43357/m.87398 type:complete len:351 (-) Transcript_43357:343-1395(-)